MAGYQISLTEFFITTDAHLKIVYRNLNRSFTVIFDAMINIIGSIYGETSVNKLLINIM